MTAEGFDDGEVVAGQFPVKGAERFSCLGDYFGVNAARSMRLALLHWDCWLRVRMRSSRQGFK